MSNRVLLAVLAHPDDESFGMGGTLALYASRGVDVHLVCATRGEVGAADEEYMKGFNSVAEMREAELRCAAGTLGLKSVHFLDYRDSGMPGTQDNNHPDAQVQHPVSEVAGKVVQHIRTLKPEVVLTFDPVGGYRHPDHIHIHQATVMAFEHAADPGFAPASGAPFSPGALYFHTMPHGFLKVAVFLLRLFGRDPRHFGRNGDIDLVPIADVTFPVHARINIRSVWEKKDQAGACHSSQGGRSLRSGLLGTFQRLFGAHETFMRAFPPFPGRGKPSSDLFQF
jgi:N-acetyl-1-D-myo-inositol-2-amino-2-deoxy-alpha-D-glucopyranoside deacetylase